MTINGAAVPRTPWWAVRTAVNLALSVPRTAIGAGSRVWRTAHAVTAAVDLIPALIERVELLVSSAEVVMVHVDAVTSAAQDVAVRVDETQLLARAIATRIDALQRRVGRLVDGVEPLLASVEQIDPALVTAMTDIVTRLQPLLSALARMDSTVPQAASTLLARSLPLIDQVDTVVVPLLREMRDAVPDVRGILLVVTRLEPAMVDVETRIAGLPGASLLRKRGEREIDDGATQSAPG